jgi:hypothetical protein
VTDGQKVSGTLAIMAIAGRRRLTFEEVLAAGQPAVYREFGDHLLYVDGRFFDVREPGAPTPIDVGGSSLPAANEPPDARRGVGIEYGWRHAADCPCSYCSASREAA